jgi:GAF domain-containing protein
MSEETTGVPEIQPEPENRHGLAELYESTRAIGLHDNLDELLREVVDRAQELIGFEHAALMLLDEKTDRLSVAHLKGYGERADEVRRLTLARGEGLSGWAAKHRESVRVGDVSQDPRYVEGLAEARSNLAVPLVVGSEVAGVINVESERPDAFTSEHEKLLTVLGAQAALAILTFRSQEALQQRLAQLGALFRISQLASEGGNLGVALNSMLEIAAEVIPQGQSAILLLDEKKGTLSVKAGQGYGCRAPAAR